MPDQVDAPIPYSQHAAHDITADLPAPGVYRHYKGKLYRVLFTAVHHETREKLVVYVPLYGEGEPNVRELSQFFDPIPTIDGESVTRFTWVIP